MYEETTDLAAAVTTFIGDSSNLLLSSSVVIRESVKDAMGNELPLSLARTLMASLYK